MFISAGGLGRGMRIHHLGIATRETEPIRGLFEDLLGVRTVHEEEFGDLRVSFLGLGEGYFELLEPLPGESTISAYLAEHGPGVHHVALQTDDIEGSLETARSLGVECVDETPRPGAWGHDVAFLHPRSTGGVLIEFVAH